MTTNTTNTNRATSSIALSPLTVLVAAWDGDRIPPGHKHYLGVTIANRGDRDGVVQVRLEGARDEDKDRLAQWCVQPEQWVALSCGTSGDLNFCIDVPADVPPQWLEYEVVARPQAAYADDYLPPTRRRLQILAPDTTETIQDSTFALKPDTTPDRPMLVQIGNPVSLELTVENRSERVDRFRLECTGLPADWTVEVKYPSDFGGLGLVRQTDSLGVNPGDRGLIQVLLHPPALPLAGSYLPTLRLVSENDPSLGLLGLIYLWVEPIYQLQTQLQTQSDQVRDRPAQFNLQFANLGNTDRRVQFTLTPLTPPHQCRYTLPTDSIEIAPQTTAIVPLEAQPQPWWQRPWIGTGKVYPFRINFIDVQHPTLAPETIPAQLTWQPRPWWQLLLAALAGLGLLGTLAFLAWWYWLRPPLPPQIVEFAAEDSRYAAANEDMARVRWQIEHPDRIQTLKLTGYSAEGEILSGPLVYEFKDGQLPAALRSFCTQQQTLLSCSQIRTDAYEPGKYLFELTLIPKGRGATPIALKSSPVEITAKPLPTVTALVPKSLVYREAAPGQPTADEQRIPVADDDGIRLDWTVTMPTDIAALHLIGRDKDGKMVGDRWFEFTTPGQVPPSLRAFCPPIGPTLICRNLPTGLSAVGEYRFELQVVPVGQNGKAGPGEGPAETKPKATELIKIQPQMPQILNFQINGQEAPAKLVIPVTQVQTPPVLQLSWRVQAGSSTQVTLTPSPGTVPLVGQVMFPLSPQGNSTIALQVKTPSGELLTRSVTIELFNPQPVDPVAQAIAAMKAATPPPPGTSPTQPINGSDSPATAPPGATPPPSSPNPFNAPAPTVPDRLSPIEQPPQFNR